MADVVYMLGKLIVVKQQYKKRVCCIITFPVLLP